MFGKKSRWDEQVTMSLGYVFKMRRWAVTGKLVY